MVPFAWHRIVLPLHDKWAPVKLNGDAREGSAEFVDLHRPRLGLRWKRLRKPPKDPERLLGSILKAEAGQLAADAAAPPAHMPPGATHALVHEDTAPYKHDLAVVYFPGPAAPASKGPRPSGAGGCLVELKYPLRRRENVLQQDLLPGLAVLGLTAPAPWAIFGLTCLTPPDLTLDRHRLNVGDLALFFNGPRRLGAPKSWAVVREIAAPTLALERSSLHGWLRTLQKPDAKFFKPAKASTPTTLSVGGREFEGLRLSMPRKRRFFPLAPLLPPSCLTLGCHDTDRDRLVLLHGTDEGLLRSLANTLGVGVDRSSVLVG